MAKPVFGKADAAGEARERVLRAAETLFNDRGYSGVTMRDIADVLQIKQPSLYYHVPGGKEPLFVEVSERTMRRIRRGLQQTIAETEPDLRQQLVAIARWLRSQPPLNLTRLLRSDLPALSERSMQHLMDLAQETLLGPIQQVLASAREHGKLRVMEDRSIVYLFLVMIEALHDLPSCPDDAETVVSLFLDGIYLEAI